METERRSVIGGGNEGDAREEKRRYWSQQLSAWKRSGESQAEYCRLHGLSPHRLTYWKRRFAEGNPQSHALVEVPPEVVPNRAEKRNSAGSAVVLEVGRYRMEIPPGFCPQSLSAVLDELEGRR